MNRRNFLKTSITGISLLAGLGPLRVLSMKEYESLGSDSIAYRFAVTSDGHYGQPDTPFDQYHKEMLGWLNGEHSRQPLNFTFLNGDLIHDDIALLPRVKQKYDQLKMPYFVSRGNHDHCDKTLWKKTWGRDLNYTFEVGDNFFIVLDTSNEKGEILCPSLDWLKGALARSKSFPNSFVFMHIPPHKWSKNGADCTPAMEMFEGQKNLRAIFLGHDHFQDKVRVANGKPYCFDSHLGGSWGTKYRGYRIVEIMKSGEVVTYQVNPASGIRVNTTAWPAEIN
jgi:3',5'-cyclic-AMP phosphodiesterase